MFKDIGKQIKNWAKANYVIGIIVSMLAGIIFFLANENASITWVGFLITFGGTITISAFSTLLYGFGEIIDKLCDIERNTRALGNTKLSKSQATTTNNASTKTNNSHNRKEKKKSVFAQETVIDLNNVDESFIDVVCPNCGEVLSFIKGETNRVCPMCNAEIDVQ